MTPYAIYAQAKNKPTEWELMCYESDLPSAYQLVSFLNQTSKGHKWEVRIDGRP